jgi:hypothetical protein
VNTPSNKKHAPAGGSHDHQRPKRRKQKLIRLDDLIPKGNVVGGQGLLFGATQYTNNNNN